MGQIGSSPLSPLCCEPQCGVPVANGSPAWTGNIGIGIVKIGDYLESVNSAASCARSFGKHVGKQINATR